MTSGWGEWSGGFTAPDGSNVYPYKPEGRVKHSPMDHTSVEVNRAVAPGPNPAWMESALGAGEAVTRRGEHIPEGDR